MLLEEIDAAIGGQQQGAADAGHRQPFPLRLGEILERGTDHPVPGQHLGHDVLDRLQRIGVLPRSQADRSMMSCPDFAKASAAIVR